MEKTLQSLVTPEVSNETGADEIFNPEAEKDLQMPRYFVEVRAIFKDGLYVVEEMLREPTRKLPKFIKVSKKEQDKSVEKTAQKAELSATT